MPKIMRELKRATEGKTFKKILAQNKISYLEKLLNKNFFLKIKLVKYIVPLEKLDENTQEIYVIGYVDNELKNIIISYNKKEPFISFNEELDFIIKYMGQEDDLAIGCDWLYLALDFHKTCYLKKTASFSLTKEYQEEILKALKTTQEIMRKMQDERS